jgi:hypothetical protein
MEPQSFECAVALTQLLARAALIGQGYDPSFPVCFSSIFYSFMVSGDPVSRWLRAYFRQEKVDQNNFFINRSFSLEQLNNLRLEQSEQESSGWARTSSANTILNNADKYRRDLDDPLLDVHHLMAAYIYEPAGHEGDFKEWKLNRNNMSYYFLGYIEVHQPGKLDYYKNLHLKTLSDQPQIQYIYPVAGYKSDEPDGADLLNITDEVNALASLLASEEIRPPLSLGLFGEWGSGKSFFMQKMQDRIKIISDTSRKNSNMNGYCKNIVQITFNAWHYSEVSLWSSLNSEIFEQLARDLEEREKDNKRQDIQDDNCTALAFERLLIAVSAKDIIANKLQKKSFLENQLAQYAKNLQKINKRLYRAFNLKHEFPNEWHRFINLPDGNHYNMVLSNINQRFPFFARKNPIIQEIKLISSQKISTLKTPLKLFKKKPDESEEKVLVFAEAGNIESLYVYSSNDQELAISNWFIRVGENADDVDTGTDDDVDATDDADTDDAAEQVIDVKGLSEMWLILKYKLPST